MPWAILQKSSMSHKISQQSFIRLFLNKKVISNAFFYVNLGATHIFLSVCFGPWGLAPIPPLFRKFCMGGKRDSCTVPKMDGKVRVIRHSDHDSSANKPDFSLKNIA
jgi:hypothetical protein